MRFVRLLTPTTDAARLDSVLTNTSGFLYYVSITGITGAAAPDPGKVAASVEAIRKETDLPIAVGFGVKSAEQAAAIGQGSDAVVVGSALVNAIAGSLDNDGGATETTSKAVLDLVAELASGVRSVNHENAA